MHILQQNHWNRMLFNWYQSYHWYEWRRFLLPLTPIESICEYWTTLPFLSTPSHFTSLLPPTAVSGEENKRKEGVCVYFFIYFRWKEVPPHGANQCLPSILACNVPFPLVLIASHRSKFSKLGYSETPVAAFSRSSALRVSNAKSRDARVENVRWNTKRGKETYC